MSTIRPTSSHLFFTLALGLSLPGCVDEDFGPEEDVASDSAAIIGGSAVSDASRRALGLVDVNNGCSGSLIHRDWVLTATHCVNESAVTSNQFSVPNSPVLGGKATRRARNLVKMDDSDVMLAELEPIDLAQGLMEWPNTSRTAAGGSLSALVGKDVTCYGRGKSGYRGLPEGGLVGFGEWRTLTRKIAAIHEEADLQVNAVGSPGLEITAPGDSGGLCVNTLGQAVAIVSRGQWSCLDPSSDSSCRATTTSVNRGYWLGTLRWAGIINALPSVRSNLQLAGITSTGTIVHTTRAASGGWTGFGDVGAVAGQPSSPVDVALQTNQDGETHALVVTGAGAIVHSLRRADGTWDQFTNIHPFAGNIGFVSKVDAAEVGDDTHVTAVAGGHIFHTIRLASGAWTAFGDIEGQTGDVGDFVKLAAAGDGAELHLCGLTSTQRVVHALRRADGSWTGFGVIGLATLDVDCSVVGGELHVVRVRADRGLEHRIRHRAGDWIAWGDLTAATGNTVTPDRISASEAGGDLHVVFRALANGHAFHTVRSSSNGGWTLFGDASVANGSAANLFDVALD